MKTLFTCVAFSLSLCALTTPAPGAVAADGAAASAASQAAIKEFFSVAMEFYKLAESVTDRASADAAAPKIESLKSRLETCESSLESNMAGLDDVTKAKMGLAMMALGRELNAQSQRLQMNDYFGSAALREALKTE